MFRGPAVHRGNLCAFYAVCASPETLIATPLGERHIADLPPGDLVFSADHLALRAVPILGVNKTPVSHHRDQLDGAIVVSAQMIDYAYSHTYDILPASNSGTYVAAGLLVGSTLK